MIASLAPRLLALALTIVPHSNAVPPVVTVQRARSLPEGERVTIAGRVTVGTGTLNRTRLVAFVQDATGGMEIYRPVLTVKLVPGDSVEVSGVTGLYFGTPELTDAQVRVIRAPRRPVQPRPIAIAAVGSHVGELVTVDGRVDGRSALHDGDLELVLYDPVAPRAPSVVVFEGGQGTFPADLSRFGPGDRLQVTGVIARDERGGGRSARYLVIPRTARDIVAIGIPRATAQRAFLITAAAFVLVVGWTVTLRMQVQHRTRDLAESQARYRMIFDSSPVGNFVSLPDGTILACNATFARMFGYESTGEVLNQSALKFYSSPEQRAEFLRVLTRDGRVSGMEGELRRRDGAPVHVIADAVARRGESGRLVEIHGFLVDITARKALEEQFRQSQKMEAVGLLAGGIAHDFNNLLTVISGHAELLSKSLAGQSGPSADAAAIREAAQRAGSLTAQLLAFSRKQLLRPRVLDLNDVIAGLEPMLGRLIGEDIQVVTKLADDLPLVSADQSQLEQVFLNLALNARDAMPAGGVLTIETTALEMDEHVARRDAGGRAGRYVRAIVRDTGHGMSAATQARIFEPFFTTKPQGRGTGLGLSTVYGIVTQSGGYVSVVSAPGRGAAFSVYLPVVSGGAGRSVQGEGDSGELSVAGGTVLVVEDEGPLRELAARQLTARGYTVITASDGEEALRVAARHEGQVDLLLTDVVMPGMSGPDVAARVRERYPNVRVLYMSGYTDDDIVRRGLSESDLAFIAKPFTAEQLDRAVRSILDRRVAAA